VPQAQEEIVRLRRQSGSACRPLNFTVRRQRMKLIVALRVSGTLNA